jgi:Fic family protein
LEFVPLAATVLDGAAEQLVDEVRDELARFKTLGEFPTEVQEELARNFLPDRISDTLNIEGIRVSPRLTRSVLEGLVVAESDKYTEQEILNVSDANALIEHDAHDGYPLTTELIREVHRRLMQELMPEAGSYRQRDVSITGAKQQPPVWSDVPDLVREVCKQVEGSKVDPLIVAVWAHGVLTRIHPFMDGNGRTGRMIQDFLLCSGTFLPVGVPIARRQEYYDALESADLGDFSPLVSIIAGAELSALDKARRIAQAPEQRRERVLRLVRKASQTVRQTEYNQYDVWRRRVEGLTDEFVRWMDDLNSQSEDFRFRYRRYAIPSFEKWCELRNRGWANGTWLLLIDVSVRGKVVHKFLFYCKRHRLNWTTDITDRLRDEVGVFLDAAVNERERFETMRYSDSYISLREVVFDRGQLVVYEENRFPIGADLPEGVSVGSESTLWDSKIDVTGSDIVERFLEDVLLKLGLIDS